MTQVLLLLVMPASLSERLRHQPGLQTDVRFSHFAFYFRFRSERRDRVHDDDVHRAAPYERIGDVERLLAVSGWETYSSSRFTPKFLAYTGSRACSASINAAMPPSFCASAMARRATVVLPEDSGPYISMILPRGMPPMPSATSSADSPRE